ncbi:MAG: phage major capsid protein, partial [Oscillospiraceae bacterium]
MTIQELMEKRAKLWDDARNFLDSKRNDSGILSEEDSKTYDAMEKQILDLTAEIDRLERLEKISQKMNAATTKPVVTAPGTHAATSEKPSTATDEYKTAFWNNIR